MKIRDMAIKDYFEVDELMQQLHHIHVEGRPKEDGCKTAGFDGVVI